MKEPRHILFLVLCALIVGVLLRVPVAYSPLHDACTYDRVLFFIGKFSAMGILVWCLIFRKVEKYRASVGVGLAVLWVIFIFVFAPRL